MSEKQRRCPRCQPINTFAITENTTSVKCAGCGFPFYTKTKMSGDKAVDDTIGRPINLSPEQRERARRLIESVDLSHVPW